MKLSISNSICYEVNNDLIEQLCDKNDIIEINKHYINNLNRNIKLNELTWEKCKMNHNYSISKEYPHYIKRNRNNAIMKMRYKDGYIYVDLDKPKLQHQVVATQFIPNPNNLPIVDHKNHSRIDNHISNLRWVSHNDNCINTSSHLGITYDFVNEIPDDSIEIKQYKGFNYNNYYISPSTKKVYLFTGANYRILLSRRKNNVNIKDINGKFHELAIDTVLNILTKI